MVPSEGLYSVVTLQVGGYLCWCFGWQHHVCLASGFFPVFGCYRCEAVVIIFPGTCFCSFGV